MISPRLIAGSASARRRSSGSEVLTVEITGNQRSSTAKTISSRMPETKAGNDRPGERDDAREPVDEAVALLRRDDAERHADDAADEERRERELDRVGQHGGDVRRDRAVGDERAAEIALRDLAHELAVLHQERLIEAEPLAQRVARLRARLVAEHDDGRIAGHDAHEHEHERQHRPQRRHREQQALAMKRSIDRGGGRAY